MRASPETLRRPISTRRQAQSNRGRADRYTGTHREVVAVNIVQWTGVGVLGLVGLVVLAEFVAWTLPALLHNQGAG